MVDVKMVFTEEEARRIRRMLSNKYNKRITTSLSTLIKIAAFTEAAEQARREMDKSIEEMNGGKLVKVPAGSGPAPKFEPIPPTPERVSDILSLVCLEIPEEEIAGWTREQMGAAIDWGAATHFKASDNVVKVPPVPVFLVKYIDAARRIREAERLKEKLATGIKTLTEIKAEEGGAVE